MAIQLEAPLRQTFRWWSVRIAAFWAVLVGAITADPGIIATAWATIPEELRPELPRWAKGALTGVILFGTIWGARVIKQKLPEPTDGASPSA